MKHLILIRKILSGIPRSPSRKPSHRLLRQDDPCICLKCVQINLPELFSRKNGVFTLQHRGIDDLTPGCKFCCILRFIWPPGSRSQTEHDIKMLTLDPQDVDSAVDCLLVFSQDWRLPKGRNGTFDRYYWESCRSIFEISANCLLDTRINYRQLRSWIDHCDEHHRACRFGSHGISLDGFQLLDVRTRKVVSATKKARRYAALSYPWGPPPKDPVSDDRQNHSFPKTITDAMQVTWELGLAFLWVDRLCIPQHDSQQKAHQIKNMHRIYRQAHFTIVAAAGNGPDHGLPGVSCERSLAPHLLVKNRLFVGNAGDPLSKTYAGIQESPWNSRAWTYQEKVFSRRLLYFTETEVVFHCKTGLHGVEDPARNYLIPGNRSLIGRYERRAGNADFHPVFTFNRDFVELTTEFNRREITRESDRVNAITGILSDMEDRNKIHGHVTGVLIFREYPNIVDNFLGLGFVGMETKNWSSAFLTGLCWKFEQCKGRRVEFPSWSWVGWNGLYSGNAQIRPDLTSVRFEMELHPSTIAMLEKRDVLLERLDEISNSSDIYLVRSSQLELMQGSGMLGKSMCRFIRIWAAVVDFTCQVNDDNRWCLASLMGSAIHEDTTIPVKFLTQEHLQPPLASAFEKFRGLVFFDIDWKSIFVIILRDNDTFSERVGSWQAHTSILFPPEVNDGTATKMEERYSLQRKLPSVYPIEKFLSDKHTYVRLG